MFLQISHSDICDNVLLQAHEDYQVVRTGTQKTACHQQCQLTERW